MVGQVTNSGSLFPSCFTFSLLFPAFPFPQEQDIPACPEAEMHKLSLGYTGDDPTTNPTTVLNPNPAPQDPQTPKRVWIKLQWDFPGASCH